METWFYDQCDCSDIAAQKIAKEGNSYCEPYGAKTAAGVQGGGGAIINKA